MALAAAVSVATSRRVNALLLLHQLVAAFAAETFLAMDQIVVAYL